MKNLKAEPESPSTLMTDRTMWDRSGISIVAVAEHDVHTRRKIGEMPIQAADSGPRRLFDITVALTLIVSTLPLALAAACLVWLTSPGPVIFSQQRCGENGTLFTLFKFRTMVDGAETVLMANQSFADEYRDHRKIERDPRVTPIGKWLRRLSIDELPQLVNVLRGEMSIVGPRPVPPNELDECYGEHAMRVLSVRPGLTGLWQVMGRSSTTYRERVELDLEYLRRRTIWFDVGLLLRTVPAVLLMRGAM